jgi:hypothetical protein
MKTNSPNTFRYIRFLLVSALLLGAVVLALAYVNVWQEKSEATEFLAMLSTVEVGSSSKSATIEAAKRFGRYENSPGQPDQQARSTWIEYTFGNRVMAALHLATPKFLYVGIEFRDGVVVKKTANFYQEPRFGVIVQEVMAPSGSAPTSNNPRQVRTNVYGPESLVINVQDDSSVPVERRKRDWQIDLSCMTMITPCRDPKDLLPGIFPR